MIAKIPTIAAMALLMSLMPISAKGADIYVRDGGSGTGTSWSDALDDLPAMTGIARGDTLYVADGTYGGHAFNKTASGTTIIAIKKATIADHGTSAGWSDAYGDGQATFTDTISFTTSYWIFNGVSGADDGSVTAYGFVVDFDEGGTGMSVTGGASNVAISYVEGSGISSFGDYNYSATTVPLYLAVCSDVVISHCYFHGGDSLVYMGDGNTSNGFDSSGIVMEYNWMQASRSSNPSFHSNLVFCTGSQNGTFRYNFCYNYTDEGLFFTGWEGSPQNWKVYGNVFTSLGGPSAPTNPRGIEMRQDYNYTGILIYNNTFVSVGTGSFLNRASENGQSSTGCAYVNNLAYASPLTIGDTTTVSNNTTDSTDRFVDREGMDFRISSDLAGTSLDAEYNTDILGNTRGSDGTWDIGAYEYAGSQPTTGRNRPSTKARKLLLR
jgi:hypothetical protein